MRRAVVLLALLLASPLPASASDMLAAVPAPVPLPAAVAPHADPVGLMPAGIESDPEPAGLTRSEALKELEKAGFKLVTRLARDDEGNWIGAARHEGRVVDVAVDNLGGVIAW